MRGLLLGFLLATTASTARTEEPVDLATLTRIRAEGLGRSQVMETAWQLTDLIGPRLTGSPALRRANDWTRQQLEAWGLANAHLEGFEFGRGFSVEHVAVRLLAPTVQPLAAYPRGWTPGTAGPLRGAVVRVDVRTEEELEKLRGQLAGKIALVGEVPTFKAPEKPLFERYSENELRDLALFDILGPGRHSGPPDREAAARRYRLARAVREFLVAENALCSLDASEFDGGALRVHRGGSWRPGAPAGIPMLVLAAEHFARLARLLDHGQQVELEVDVRTRFHDDDSKAYNTIAELPGTDRRGEVVMVGAHLDSWHAGTGATDNAAGVAMAMEAMRILASLDSRPRRTIRIGLWSGEEQGLLGSAAYVRERLAARTDLPTAGESELPRFLQREQELKAPLALRPEHARLSAYFNLDNGTGRVRGIYTQANPAVVPIFEAWLAPLRDLGATTVSNRTTGSTDHMSFDDVGLPGFQLIQDSADYETRTHHTSLDVYERLQQADLMQGSVVLATLAWQAANRDALLPRKPLPAPRLPAPARPGVVSAASARP